MMINWHSVFFYFFALLTGVFALAVVLSSNIVRMAGYLVVTLGAVAGLFFLAGAEFLGAVQLLVYVGGTMVLLVFGVMLTARGSSAPMKIGGLQGMIVVLIAGALLAMLLPAALRMSPGVGPKTAEVRPASAPLGLGLLGIRVDQMKNQLPNVAARESCETDLSRPLALAPRPSSDLRSGYLLVLELLSVHLLVVLIGAAYLARAKIRESKVDCRMSGDANDLRDSTLDLQPSNFDHHESIH
jgi:NADH-quinone oxidoreductase subunit J